MKEVLLKSKIVFFIRIFIELFHAIDLYTQYLINRDSPDTLIKMRAYLSIRIHALEKGMSIGNVKVGFGIPKVLVLIRDLQRYQSTYGNDVFWKESCEVINEYIRFNVRNGADMQKVQSALDKMGEIKCRSYKGGILKLVHKQITEKARGDFEKLSQSRYSIRDFADQPISLIEIEKALKLCERTPSACNRQSWKVHVIADEKIKNKLFELQLGCNGFYDKMQYAILICGDISYYGFPEFNQVYVDGGLYAMNLMYALNFYDVATIPLTMQHKHSHTNKIKRAMHLSPSEVPVVLIGAGSYKDEFKVACSMRKPYSEYTTIYQ